MDDKLALAEPVSTFYRCPGESRDIDRATHMGRLAAFYPACRTCVHRADVRELSPLEARRWEEVLRRGTAGPCFNREGFEAQSVNDLTSPVVRRFVTALAVTLWRSHNRGTRAPVVLVGADGHWTTAELLSSTCDALALAGCRAIECGAVTSASLAVAADHAQSDAALWIGNASGRPHSMALRLWGRGGRPWSSPGGLERVREAFDARAARPKRKGGAVERMAADEIYLPPLRPLFHALRPLRFVVDTACEPLVGYLRGLTAEVACEILRPRALAAAAAGAIVDAGSSFLDRRLAALARQVIADQAHFAVWIDGGGETCRLLDERGAIVESERLLGVLAAYVLREKPGATLVLEPHAGKALCRALSALDARVVCAAATRERMCAAIESSGAVLGGGSSGTVWFAGHPPVADGLFVISLLLTILSASDRPASDVLDAA